MNARFVLGSRFCGWGRSGIELLCAMLALPPPISNKAFTAHSRRVNFIMSKHGCGPYDVLDVTVTCD